MTLSFLINKEMERYEEGYTKLLTYKQGMEIYQRTKRFTAAHLDRIKRFVIARSERSERRSNLLKGIASALRASQ